VENTTDNSGNQNWSAKPQIIYKFK